MSVSTKMQYRPRVTVYSSGASQLKDVAYIEAPHLGSFPPHSSSESVAMAPTRVHGLSEGAAPGVAELSVAPAPTTSPVALELAPEISSPTTSVPSNNNNHISSGRKSDAVDHDDSSSSAPLDDSNDIGAMRAPEDVVPVAQK